MGLVANRRREVDHGVHASKRLALKVVVSEAGEIPKRDLDLDPVAPEAARIADQRTDVLALREQAWEERPADRSARAG
jgi:hypothetical protein